MTELLLLDTYLKHLRLPTFVRQHRLVAEDAARQQLDYDRYLLALAELEVHQREQNLQARTIKAAHFPVLKELADFDFSCVTSPAKLSVLDLARGSYLEHAEPIILVGNPGLGKTHIATGLALAACRQGRRVRFYNAAGLVNELLQAQDQHHLPRFLAGLLKQHLIVIDELGFIPFTTSGAQLLFQVCSSLYERVALILTTNLRFADWTQVFGDERLTGALLDRLTHRAHILEFMGESYRFRQHQPHAVGVAPEAQAEDRDAGKVDQPTPTDWPTAATAT
jgi:DNA replication protein DnaC